MIIWSAIGPLVGIVIGGAITWAQQGRANKRQSEREWQMFQIETITRLQEEIDAAAAYMAKLNAQLKLAQNGNKPQFEQFDVPVERFNQIAGLSSRLESRDFAERIRAWAGEVMQRSLSPEYSATDPDAIRLGTERGAIIDELGTLLRAYYPQPR